MAQRKLQTWRIATAAALLLGATFAGAGSVLAQSADWQKQVAKLIVENQSYPRSAQVKKEEGTAKVKVTMDSSGKITAVEVVQPTSSDILNREAEKIMQKIGAFPAPPGGAPMSLVIPITWRLS